eukprot:NODE_615_length_5377_cov_0.537514.p4 type:complete len:103 gc:universal NODE_615_length_5377_cov_0.537514:670-362(-)
MCNKFYLVAPAVAPLQIATSKTSTIPSGMSNSISKTIQTIQKSILQSASDSVSTLVPYKSLEISETYWSQISTDDALTEKFSIFYSFSPNSSSFASINSVFN